jgi:hypothetical protein
MKHAFQLTLDKEWSKVDAHLLSKGYICPHSNREDSRSVPCKIPCKRFFTPHTHTLCTVYTSRDNSSRRFHYVNRVFYKRRYQKAMGTVQEKRVLHRKRRIGVKDS